MLLCIMAVLSYSQQQHAWLAFPHKIGNSHFKWNEATARCELHLYFVGDGIVSAYSWTC